MTSTFKAEEIARTKEFIDFYESAVNYCAYIEQSAPVTAIDFLKALRGKLLNLYSTALHLQWVDKSSEIECHYKVEQKEQVKNLSAIADKLKNHRFYWHVFDPTNHEDTEPVCGDLVDDLGDIYQDLKSSVMTYHLNGEACRATALWQFKFDFARHWSDHCINGLAAIHFFLQNE